MRDKMKYTGVELFMKKLKQMIYDDDNPLITNLPSILSQRPQFQLLYEEIGSVIQTLHSIDDEHQEVIDLKKRFKDAAEDAHYVIDLFVYNINRPKRIKERILRGVCSPSHQHLLKRDLENVMRSIKSIKEELITIQSNMKMDPSPRNDNIKASIVVTETSCTKDPLALETKNPSEDIVVGFDRQVKLIRDKLVEDQKQLDVVSIIGMGGLGKTTLATKVFNDPFIKHHFHLCGWVTISQTYEKQDLLKQFLKSTGSKIENLSDHDYSQLRQMLHQKLIGKRYLIVIDDIWNLEAWDAMKLSFPNNHVRSRILVTSRLKEVVLHVKSNGFIHQLEYLNEEESWELLSRKVFHDRNACPKQLVELGMEIERNCHGLPLTLVVVSGVLAKKPLRKDSWERIGRSVSSYIVSNKTGSVETLAWSFNHLPGHIRDCYLYLGGFPEDYMFQVQHLIWLWMAEGFIQEDGIRSLEEIAECHVIELIERNLVIVGRWNYYGSIKSFYVHDLLRELCFKIATKENFYLKAQRTTRSLETYKQQRIFIEDNINRMNAPRIRSLLCFYKLFGRTKRIKKWSHSCMLLMVLDLRGWQLDYFPNEMSRLVHLRYLAISYSRYEPFPTSICKLWSLQTLIIRNKCFSVLELPKAISNLVNLRHLMSEVYRGIKFPSIQRPMNLQSISRVMLGDGAESWEKCFPGIKKLSCYIREHNQCDLESLTSLEHLDLSYCDSRELNFIQFPFTLKSLSLEHCRLPWSGISTIQTLPNLQVLNLLSDAFVGPKWDAGVQQFSRLKFLKLYKLDIKEWEASSINFPCLKQLVVKSCIEIEEIPSDFGNIPTLELISISCNYTDTLRNSLDVIRDEQHDQGNFELKISYIDEF